MKAPVLLLSTLLLAAVFAGVATQVANAGEKFPVTVTYQVYCARCHGADGHGDGPDGATLSVKPRDFADCAKMSKISDATITKAITDGGAAVGLNREMPAWGAALSSGQVKALKDYVRTFCKKK